MLGRDRMKYCENFGQLFSIVACIVSISGTIQSCSEQEWSMIFLFVFSCIVSFVAYVLITKHVIECEEYRRNHKE